jgi:hypothetical protein
MRLLKYTYTCDHEDGIYGTYKRAVANHMWHINTPKFAKLWLNINGAIWWPLSIIDSVAERGHDKLFNWMRNFNHLNLCNVNKRIVFKYENASLRLAIVLKNPDLITEKNIPKDAYYITKDVFDAKLDAHCLDKVLSLANFTIFDMMKQFISNGALRHAKSLMCTLMDKILRDFPEGVKYSNYQEILDKYYPNVIVYKGDINDFKDPEFDLFGQDLQGCIIPELIEACRNNSISDESYNLYKIVHCCYCESCYDMLPFYCGIMASNYNKDVIDTLNENLFDTVPILEAACRYRHKKMIRIIVDYVRRQCS